MIKFGTDGWRAVIAEDFTFENVKIVAQAVADYLKNIKRGQSKVVIGYDCRFLSGEFAQTVALVLAANNIKTVLSDTNVPTPTVSFHCRYHKYDLGVMITASHNPAKFNGFKIKTKEGGSADKSITNEVEKLLHKSKIRSISKEEALKKKLLEIKDLTSSQIQFIKRFIDLKSIRKLKLKVLIDTMYGAGVGFVDKILGDGNIKIDYIHNEYNPSFAGIHPEPVEPYLQELINRMKKGNYDLGLALDGDADRLAMVDSKGNFVNAQVLLPLLAIHMVKNRKKKGGLGKTVVGSNVIDDVALSLGIACYETKVGFKYLSNLFKEHLIFVGGEEAGGIGFEGYIPERDGSLAFLMVLEMIAKEKKSFDKLLSQFYKKYGRWFYDRTAISVHSLKKGLDSLKFPSHLFGEKIARVNKMDGIKMITKDYWLMLRASGTEPIVRIYAEAKSKKKAKELIGLGKKMIHGL